MSFSDKDKLSVSKSYPSFNSYESNYRFELFESVNVLGGLDLKGEIAYFKNPNGCVELSFQDDDMDYLVLTEKIQLTADKFFVPKSFLIFDIPIMLISTLLFCSLIYYKFSICL